jgi:membrane carboxypeptidase/penicillin-binding protein
LSDRSVAGKTGTSQDSGNAWFVGYTPTLSTAVWLGYKDRPRKIILGGYGLVEGGELPAKTWSRYMALALEGVPASEFGQPAPIIRPRKLSVKEETKFRERKEIVFRSKRRFRDTPRVWPARLWSNRHRFLTRRFRPQQWRHRRPLSNR